VKTSQIRTLIDEIETLRQTITNNKEEDWLTFASLTNTLARAINLRVTIPDKFDGDWSKFHTHPAAVDSRRVVTAAERFISTIPSEQERDDSELMLAILTRTLGEIYRIQQNLGMNVPVSDGVVYGLLDRVEKAVSEVLPDDPLPAHLSDAAERFLDQFYQDSEKMKSLKGFYDIERSLEAIGIDRSKAIKLFTYLHNDGRFGEVTAKMNSQHSPTEVKTFELSNCEMGYKKEDPKAAKHRRKF
jgi:hypothetical protein